MAYLSRHSRNPRPALAPELVYLLVVVAAAVSTAWWAGQKLGMDLSGLTTAAQFLGLTETTTTAPEVGYEAPSVAPQPAAPFCSPGQAPAFANGMAQLKQAIGDVMGTPVECEHPDSAAGDTVQQTTTGLAAYSRQTNTVTFTDGWRHWALTPNGAVRWEGTDAQPPATTAPAAG
jgi:hypothetical protein